MLEQAVTCPAATYRWQHAKHAKTFFYESAVADINKKYFADEKEHKEET
jgi:hypothetical protein